MIPATTTWLRARLDKGDCVDIRGLGKAGGGLVVAIQAFAESLMSQPALAVQDWPLFSSARKGANVTAYLRVARGQVENTSRVSSPDIAVLMNEAAAEDADFAEGTEKGLFVVNTTRTPEEVARKYRLGGTVVTVDGDALGRKHLGVPLPNVAVLAALVRATELVDVAEARASMAHRLEKRRIPARLVQANLAIFDEALESFKVGEFESSEKTRHQGPVFKGYGELPVGAQSKLRTSANNRTSGYGRPGVNVEFSDAAGKCNGCSLCVVQCPEGIIEFTPDPERGTLVTGARFEQSCKKCRECITACPLNLFSEVAIVAPPDHHLEGA
jgi:pyruvate ferredoxin oxidoreductase gamma subunit